MNKYYILLFTLIAFFSCNDEKSLSDFSQRNDISKTSLNANDSVRVINGILVFKSTEIAFKFAEKVNTLIDTDSLDQWEQSQGFISQRRIFKQIVAAESKLAEKYEQYSEEERKDFSINKLHSDEFTKAMASGIIKYELLPDGNNIYNYSNCKSNLVSLINADGIFAIGDTVYQFTKNEEKVWTDANLDDIEKIKSAKKSIASLNIKVSTQPTLTLRSTQSTSYMSTGWNDYKPKRSFIAEMSSNSYQYLGDGTQWKSSSVLKMRHMKKTWYGSWIYDWTNIDLYFRRQGKIRYMPDYPNSMWITQVWGSAIRYPDSGYYSQFPVKDGSIRQFSLFTNELGETFYTSYYENGKKCVLDEVGLSNFFMEAKMDNGNIITLGDNNF